MYETSACKFLIELAVKEAQKFGQDYIGTEHLLLGLLDEGEGLAAGVLEDMGINLQELRENA
jgi:ATP-dependent Clp protease ATP-binding subunit ClpC